MSTIIRGMSLLFGTGNKVALPSGWSLLEAEGEFAMGVTPSLDVYFLSKTHAYPCRVWGPEGLYPGKRYIDTATGVIAL